MPAEDPSETRRRTRTCRSFVWGGWRLDFPALMRHFCLDFPQMEPAVFPFRAVAAELISLISFVLTVSQVGSSGRSRWPGDTFPLTEY